MIGIAGMIAQELVDGKTITGVFPALRLRLLRMTILLCHLVSIHCLSGIGHALAMGIPPLHILNHSSALAR